MYHSIVAVGLQKLGVQISGSDVPAVNVSVSLVEGVLPGYFNSTDVTLTENRNKYKFFSKVHYCQRITSGKCVALMHQCHKCHFN